MKKFFENIIIILIYALMFYLLIDVAHPNLTWRQYIGYSLILSVFAGLINNLEGVLRELLGNKDK